MVGDELSQVLSVDGGTGVGQSWSRKGVGLELKGLERNFGATRALDGLTLSIRAGELVVFLGPSGCGKTTALRAIAGLEPLDGGRIEIEGQDISSTPTSKREMGMVFQAYSLFPNMTVAQNIAYGLKLRKVDKSQINDRVEEMLKLVRLGEQADRYPKQLSGGQQQRVALARALAISPKVLLLDEPLSALDAKVRVQLREEIRRIQLEFGITTIFVTHDQDEALAIADRIAVLNQGNIEQFGTPDEVYVHPASPFVASFVGHVNHVRGRVVAQGRANVFGVEVSSDRFDRFSVGEELDVLVRPELISISRSGASNATVSAVGFMGSTLNVMAATDDGTLVRASVTFREGEMIRSGDRVRLDIDGGVLFATAVK